MINFFGFFKKTNHIGISSVGFEKAAIFLKNRDFRVVEMVRKFMVWKTNKEATGEYPAYVYHYTDFSAGRAEMLKKEIKLSDSK